MSATTPTAAAATTGDRAPETSKLVPAKKPLKPARVLLHVFLIVTALIWMVPIAGAIFSSFRPFSDTVKNGFFSWPKSLTLDNYAKAWTQGEILHKYWNTFLIVAPSLVLVLWLSSMVAFAVSRYSWKLNVFFLVLFTAGNLLPQQIIIQPLFQMYNRIPLPEFMSNSGRLNGSTWGLILIHVAFQSGFCTFVLSNYMKLLPKSLNDAARVDGASIWTLYSKIILPLTKPALAALATLEFTWIYNDFFWAVVLEQQGADRPITSSLANLGGEFFTDDNLIAAASMYVAIPTLLVYLLLQRHFIAGLTLGADKG